MSFSQAAASRFNRAEQRGLRLAILCRTFIAGVVLIYLAGWGLFGDMSPRPWALVAVFMFVVTGVAHLSVIGSAYDSPWIKYAIYAFDAASICALFVIIPVSRADDVPQIIAFRAYGIYYLFPILALSALSLSWKLVLWTGVAISASWWAAFFWVTSTMARTLSWADVPLQATRDDYEAIFLSIDFIGQGNRIEETGFLMVTAFVLAVVVYRARSVFFAQIKAEAKERREREKRSQVAETLGRFVPEEIADRVIRSGGAMAPQESHGTVLVLDVVDFTGFAARNAPTEVIRSLDQFLSTCTELIAAQSGVVISFTGDGVLAAFNTPLAVDAPEGKAVSAARAIAQAAPDLGFEVRVGIASGPVASGSVGSKQRLAFTIYGTTVNRAARLEAFAKVVGHAILMDDATASKLANRQTLKALGDHELRGLEKPVAVYGFEPPK